MLSEIQHLIAHFNYESALDWYKKNVPSEDFYKKLFSSGADNYNQKKLLERLHLFKASLNNNPEKIGAGETELKGKILETIKANPLQDLKTDSQKEIELIDNQWKPLFAKANHYFEHLDYIEDPLLRKEQAFKILNLMDEVADFWYEKEYLKSHGISVKFKVPESHAYSPAQAATRIRTLRTYISKAKNGILDKSKIPNWEMEIIDLNRFLQ